MNVDEKRKYEEQLELCKAKVESSLRKCLNIGSGRPHEYEHNHFMLTEDLAEYIIISEKLKNIT